MFSKYRQPVSSGKTKKANPEGFAFDLISFIASSTLCRKLFVQIVDHEVGAVVFLGQSCLKLLEELDNIFGSARGYLDLVIANPVGNL